MSKPVFRVAVLPAGVGDAVVIEYGPAESIRCVLIDGGIARVGTVVNEYLGANAKLELLVVTHIDSDHIGGVLNLLNLANAPTPNDIWFNGYKHLFRSGLVPMGPKQAEALTSLINAKGYAWNNAFEGKAVVREDRADVKLPVRELSGGLTCTVLSPGYAQLEQLRDETTWERIVLEAEQAAEAASDDAAAIPQKRLLAMGGINIDELADEHTDPDRAPANGSSIALLVKYEKYRCLLGADAHPDVLIDAIDRLVGKGKTLEVDVFKLPHHGSKANVTRELISRVRARSYVFSSNGHGRSRHPDDQAVARVITYGGPNPLLAFNYHSERNKEWDSEDRQNSHPYRTMYPPPGGEGIVIDVPSLA